MAAVLGAAVLPALARSAPITCAVWPFEAKGVSEQDADVLSAALRTHIFLQGGLTLLERSKMDELVQEAGFSTSLACSESECLIQLGRYLPVQWMIGGSAGKVGGTYTLNATAVDIETSQVVGSALWMKRGEIDLVLTEGVPAVVRELGVQLGITDEGSEVALAETPVKPELLAGPMRVHDRWFFSVEAPDAKEVCLAGGFNAWSTDGYELTDHDGDGIWTGAFEIEDGRYEYKFVVDGGKRWIEDDHNPQRVEDGYGGWNSVLDTSTSAAVASHVTEARASEPVRIPYEIGGPGRVVVKVHSMSGDVVRVLLDAQYTAAVSGSVEWDGRDDEGRRCASGTYVYEVQAAGESGTGRVFLY